MQALARMHFMRFGLVAVSLFSSLLLAQEFDIVITGAKVIDGSGSPWFYADVAIRGDTIAGIGSYANRAAAVRIDARGMAVAPGFIDIHSHGRRGIFDVPTAENYLREGVTTIVEGPDGSSPLPLAPFLERVAKTPISVNFATFAGQAFSIVSSAATPPNAAP